MPQIAVLKLSRDRSAPRYGWPGGIGPDDSHGGPLDPRPVDGKGDTRPDLRPPFGPGQALAQCLHEERLARGVELRRARDALEGPDRSLEVTARATRDAQADERFQPECRRNVGTRDDGVEGPYRHVVVAEVGLRLPCAMRSRRFWFGGLGRDRLALTVATTTAKAMNVFESQRVGNVFIGFLPAPGSRREPSPRSVPNRRRHARRREVSHRRPVPAGIRGRARYGSSAGGGDRRPRTRRRAMTWLSTFRSVASDSRPHTSSTMSARGRPRRGARRGPSRRGCRAA